MPRWAIFLTIALAGALVYAYTAGIPAALGGIAVIVGLVGAIVEAFGRA